MKIEIYSPKKYLQENHLKKEDLIAENVMLYSRYLIDKFTKINYYDLFLNKDFDSYEFVGSIIIACMLYRDRCLYHNSIPFSEMRRIFDNLYLNFKRNNIDYLVDWRWEDEI